MDCAGELDRRAEVVFRLLGSFDGEDIAGDEVGERQRRWTPAPLGDGEYVGDEVGGSPGIARIRHGEPGTSQIPRRLEKVAVGTRQCGRFLIPRGGRSEIAYEQGHISACLECAAGRTGLSPQCGFDGGGGRRCCALYVAALPRTGLGGKQGVRQQGRIRRRRARHRHLGPSEHLGLAAPERIRPQRRHQPETRVRVAPDEPGVRGPKLVDASR